MPQINCEFNLMLTYSENCVTCNTVATTTFSIKNTIFFIRVVTLPIQGNVNIPKQLRLEF